LRISRKNQRYQQDQHKRHRTNAFIKSLQVRLIDETGQNIGVIDTAQALEMAAERGLDLVEVSPLANPPVAKIVDYSKLRYQEEKERRKEKARQKKVEIKGIRMSLRISEHDTEVRIEQAVKFLTQGDKVKAALVLKGREHQHMGLARENLEKFVAAINEKIPVTLEQPITAQGGNFSVVMAKK